MRPNYIAMSASDNRTFPINYTRFEDGYGRNGMTQTANAFHMLRAIHPGVEGVGVMTPGVRSLRGKNPKRRAQ